MANAILEALKPRTDVMLTALSPDACAERLKAAVDNNLSIFGSRPFIGSVSPAGARLRKRIRYRNSFQTVVQVSFESQVRGAEVVCRSGMSFFVYVFLVAWFGFLTLFLLGGVSQADASGGLFLVVPLGMMAFGVGLVLFGRWLARDEHDEAVAFLGRVLQAQASTRPTNVGGRSIVE